MDTITVYYHPADGTQVRQRLLSTVMDRLPQPVGWVRTHATPQEADWAKVLRRMGFQFTTQITAHTIRLPAPTPPVRGGVVVRAVDTDELRSFHAILADAYRDVADYNLYGYDDWLQASHRDEGDMWLVAAVEEMLVGALQSCTHSDLPQIHHVCVARSHRRQAIGMAPAGRGFQTLRSRRQQRDQGGGHHHGRDHATRAETSCGGGNENAVPLQHLRHDRDLERPAQRRRTSDYAWTRQTAVAEPYPGVDATRAGRSYCQDHGGALP